MEKNFSIPDLLLDCLGRINSESIQSKLDTLGADDWEALVLSAQRHGVASLLYFCLKSGNLFDSVPPKITQRLHNMSLRTAGRNVRIYNQLSKIISAFNDFNIPSILLKGAYLIEGVYDNIAMRTMVDLDIMLRKEDLQKGEKVLNEMGYSAIRPYIAEIDSVRHQHILPFTKENAVPIELHWNIHDPVAAFKINPRDLWRRAQSFSVAGYQSKVLCLEDQVLHLAIHCSYHHCFNMGLMHLYDIDQIISKFINEIDWEVLLARSEEWGFDRCLYLTFLTISELLGTHVPEDVMKVSAPVNSNSNIRVLVQEQLFSEMGDFAIAPTLPKLVEMKGSLKKTTFLLSRVFPSRKEMVRFYPITRFSPMLYLYYFVRIRDIFKKYGKGLSGVMNKNQSAIKSLSHRQKKDKLKAWMREEGKITIE